MSTPPLREKRVFYQVNGKKYYPLTSTSGFVQEGLASWYGGEFHGLRTANGERYDMYGRTAAHKTLPFDTYVAVINLRNGKQTVARINDRGPFVRGRIIDLTYTLARELEMEEEGVVPVRIKALGYSQTSPVAGNSVGQFVEPASYLHGEFTIQVGAFAEKENALKLHASLSRRYRTATVTVFDRGRETYYRVRVGEYSHFEEAKAEARQMQEQGFPTAFVVARDR